MKSDYNQKVEKLQARLSGLSHPEVNMKDLLDKGIDTLLRADYIYETADTEKKRRLIGSMFPEKMHFEKSSLRTGRVNEAVRFIYRIDSALCENKNRTNENKSHLSCDVGMTGFERGRPGLRPIAPHKQKAPTILIVSALL